MEKICKKHGLYKHYKNGARWRCSKCRVEVVAKHRKDKKQKLVDMLGGKCTICGYSKYVGSLDFHHLDRKTKEFGIASKGNTNSWAKVVAEAKKCVLLCKNCHGEVEAGLAKIGM